MAHYYICQRNFYNYEFWQIKTAKSSLCGYYQISFQAAKLLISLILQNYANLISTFKVPPMARTNVCSTSKDDI